MEVHSSSEDKHPIPQNAGVPRPFPALSLQHSPSSGSASGTTGHLWGIPSSGTAGSEGPQPFPASMPRPHPTSSSLAKPSIHPHLSSLPWHHLEVQCLSRCAAWHVARPTGQFCFDSGSWAILCALSYGCSEDHTSTWGPTCAPLTTTHLEGWPWCPVHVGGF